jgi:hypothetical protein
MLMCSARAALRCAVRRDAGERPAGQRGGEPEPAVLLQRLGERGGLGRAGFKHMRRGQVVLSCGVGSAAGMGAAS